MRQITNHLLMVRPVSFGYNEETATNNAFQVNDPSLDPQQIREQAVLEFESFVHRLRDAGVNVHVVEDSRSPVKPDAVFPNNWVTFHEDGRVVTYPMNAPTRRHERREDIIEALGNRFRISQRIHFEGAEAEKRFLEGTGSLILDRPNRIAYACLSPRTDESLLDEFCERMDFRKVAFTAVDGDGKQIYHTNVMMALGETFVVVCLDSVPDADERAHLVQQFENTNKEVIDISLPQMMQFAGNMLQVASQDGQSYLVMSEQAYESLTTEQVDAIKRHTKPLHSPLYTIERYGGGSARCMMAEVFLREK
jgi:hypothetical protein